MSHYLIYSIIFLMILVSAPLWVALIFGSTIVCGATTKTQCFKDWISAMAGPLAIIAALIAAWPVFDQLEESRIATRIALASIIRIEEQDIEGAMAALKSEDKQVEDSRKIPIFLISLINTAQADHKAKNDRDYFTLFAKTYEDTVASCRIIAQEMASKMDKDTVLPHRKEIGSDFVNIIKRLEQLQEFKDRADDYRSNDEFVPAIKIAAQSILQDIITYEEEYHKLDTDMVIKRDKLAKKRQVLTDTALPASLL